MVLSRNYLKSFIGSRSFYKAALAVMIPVVIQQMISTLFNTVDNIMVGQINGISMSAVTVANKPYLIMHGIIFGMTGAGGLLISQYYGAQKYKICQGLYALQTLIVMSCAVLFCCALYFFPGWIMRIFLADPETIYLGEQYLRIVAFSYLPMCFSTVLIYNLRALGQNRMPVVVSVCTMLLNAALNYVLIFGHMGFQAMGVAGAAWGTLLARLFEMVFYILVLARRKTFFSFQIRGCFPLSAAIVKGFFKRAFPLTANEILWTIGLNIYFWAYARLNEAALPALTIADQIMQLGLVLQFGSASAISVMVGTELGAGRLKTAKQNTKYLFTLVTVIGAISTTIVFTLSYVLPFAFRVEPELQSVATQLTQIYALFFITNALYSSSFYCFRAGGDAKTAALLDSGYMWLLIVPVAVAFGIWGPGHLSIQLAVLIIQLLMTSKVFIALHLLRKGKWLRNIASGTEPE